MTFKLPEEQVEEQEVEEGQESEAQEVEEQPETQEVEEQPEAQGDALVIDLGGSDDDGPPPGTKTADWVKNLRKQNREQARELRELRQRQNAETVVGLVEPGPEPDLEALGFNTETYKTAYADWLEKKRVYTEAVTRQQQTEEQHKQRWQAKLGTYGQAKQALKVEDFAEAESVVLDLLSQTQQGIIVSGAKDAALMVYALGKNPEMTKKLAAIDDAVEFAFAIARLEAQMKVNTKKPTTVPESKVTGNGRAGGSLDSQLNRLRDEAVKTGDYTKVNAYKAQQKAASKR